MNKPVVAILGRPNVGKSTLFNRIIRRREAIVHDVPGVTRDRNYAPADWAGREFQLLDTGGYVPTTEDVFERAIREQIEIALSEAHLIVLVTDVVDGVTPVDEEIAAILRRSGRTVVLAVNKVDNEIREGNIVEFYRLGLGEPHPISAMSGRALGDFLDVIINELPDQQSIEEEDTAIRLTALGRPNVGKSSFVNAILGQDKMIVTDIAGTTRDAIDTRARYQNKDIILIDTAGLRKRARVHENIEYYSNVRAANALQRADVAIVLVDATQNFADQDKKIIMMAIEQGKGVVVAVNKWDLIEKDTMTARRFELEMQDELRELTYVPILFISALTKQRVYKVVDVALSIYTERQKKVTTGELNRFLADAVEQHHPPAYGTKWVKLNYATQVKTTPPLFVFFTNEPRGIKKNYRNYLENKLREQFGFLGVPIRMSFRKKNK